jgi:UDP-glucose 4-epimerase
MKVLVVGGAGYVGSHVVKGLLAQGDLAVVVDNFLSGHRELLPKEVPVISCDMGVMAAIHEVLKQHPVDAVVHCACLRGESRSIKLPFHYHHNNFIATFYLLQALEQHNIHRFLLVSDFSVYGSSPKLPITLQTPLAPCTPVGNSLAAVEALLRDLEQHCGMHHAIVRLPNLAGALPKGDLGPWVRDDSERLMSKIFAVARQKKPTLTIHGNQFPTADGTPVRDFVHIADGVDAILLAIRRLYLGISATYLLGSGQPTTIRELVDLVSQVTHCTIPTEEGTPLPGQSGTLYVDPSETRKILQWAPRYDLRQIIEHEWAWNTKHFENFREMTAAETSSTQMFH